MVSGAASMLSCTGGNNVTFVRCKIGILNSRYTWSQETAEAAGKEVMTHQAVYAAVAATTVKKSHRLTNQEGKRNEKNWSKIKFLLPRFFVAGPGLPAKTLK